MEVSEAQKEFLAVCVYASTSMFLQGYAGFGSKQQAKLIIRFTVNHQELSSFHVFKC